MEEADNLKQLWVELLVGEQSGESVPFDLAKIKARVSENMRNGIKVKTLFKTDIAHIQQVKFKKVILSKVDLKWHKVKKEVQVQIEVQDIDHLGIIAGIIDDIGIVEIIDQEIGTDVTEKVSAGQVVKAMIINCMGFLTAPLYLFSEFFGGKATELIIFKRI